MHISDPREVEEVLSFFRTHLGRELDIAFSMFEGRTQYERMKVQEVDAAPPRVLLLAPKSQRQIAIDPHQKRGVCEFVLTEAARCPNCRAKISGRTLVEPQGGIEVEAGVGG